MGIPDQGTGRPRHSLAPPKPSGGTDSESVYDTADDEMLDAVMKSATKVNTRAPSDRKRSRNRERKSRESPRYPSQSPGARVDAWGQFSVVHNLIMSESCNVAIKYCHNHETSH